MLLATVRACSTPDRSLGNANVLAVIQTYDQALAWLGANDSNGDDQIVTLATIKVSEENTFRFEQLHTSA